MIRNTVISYHSRHELTTQVAKGLFLLNFDVISGGAFPVMYYLQSLI